MGGVGRAAAQALARAHYRVAVLYRNSREDEVAEARASLPGEHMFIQCDVTNGQDVARAIDKIYAKTGRIDAAIHAAVGPIIREKILSLDESAFRGQFEAGFFGAFNFLQPIAKIMKGQGHGTLIGITSAVIEAGATPARMGAYAVGKIALRGLLRELHRELSPAGVRVLAVAPGLMRTRLNADLPEKFFEMAGAALMTPEAAAEAIAALCADATIPSGVSYLVSSGETSPL
jgi:3-oxoacyl-[acyl-carrier protein] reductase